MAITKKQHSQYAAYLEQKPASDKKFNDWMQSEFKKKRPVDYVYHSIEKSDDFSDLDKFLKGGK